VIHLLLERRATASLLLSALEAGFTQRVPIAVATILEDPHIARRHVAGLNDAQAPRDALGELAEEALARCISIDRTIVIDGVATRAWTDYRLLRPGLRIFGAGDDAQPLVRLADELGWFVSVADGRSHLATRQRFPSAEEVCVLPIRDAAPEKAADLLRALSAFRARDAAILMTHSFEQDAQVLAALFAQSPIPHYVGVLGPRRRSRELLADVARQLEIPESKRADHAEEWLDKLHAPTGLDLGAESPETIALSILAEVQQSLTGTTAEPLRKIRAAR
jgi:xanthine/CO dehydrogenase XdhC/CoxF family maturation factor